MPAKSSIKWVTDTQLLQADFINSAQVCTSAVRAGRLDAQLCKLVLYEYVGHVICELRHSSGLYSALVWSTVNFRATVAQQGAINSAWRKYNLNIYG